LKEKLLNVALLVGSVIFTLLAMEVGLRAYVALKSYEGGWSIRSIYEYQFKNLRDEHAGSDAYDPELGWVPKDEIRSNGGGEVWDATDPILAVGDSFTFGSQVSDRETWPAQLEKLSGTRVVNGGVGAYGIDQAFLRARRLLSRYRFSTVIFSFIPDDIRRCQLSVFMATAKPYFDFKEGRLSLENVPVPPPSRPPNESGLLTLLEHSQLLHSVMKRLFPVWWQRSWEIQVHDEGQGREIACAVLHELEGLTKSRGSKLIVLIQHREGEGFSESMAVESVVSCLSDPGTRVIDLKPALFEVKAKDLSTYNRMYVWSMTVEGMKAGHMSAEGNQFVARELSKLFETKPK
jgi:hypothetical protein